MLEIGASTIADAVVAALIVISASGGVWLGKRLSRLLKRPGEPQLSLRDSLRRSRAQTRQLLTPGERRFAYGYTLVSGLLPPVAIGFLVFGTSTTRAVGAGLLLLALVLMAVPISPFLRARVRRRAARASDRE
jgi:hypothetical protein